jgi:hypothetical protein
MLQRSAMSAWVSLKRGNSGVCLLTARAKGAPKVRTTYDNGYYVSDREELAEQRQVQRSAALPACCGGTGNIVNKHHGH